MRPSSCLALFAALALTGACKSDGASSPQQPTASPAPVPPEQGGEVVAEPGGRQQMTPDERRAERLKRYDSNADGRLDRTERDVMRREAIDRRMTRLDTDADGKVSRDEAVARPFGQRLLADFDRADTDRDSFISRAELERVIDERRQERRAQRMQERLQGNQPGAGPRQRSGTPPPASAEPDDGYDSLDDE